MLFARFLILFISCLKNLIIHKVPKKLLKIFQNSGQVCIPEIVEQFDD